jgi:hypothetical protein
MAHLEIGQTFDPITTFDPIFTMSDRVLRKIEDLLASPLDPPQNIIGELGLKKYPAGHLVRHTSSLLDEAPDMISFPSLEPEKSVYSYTYSMGLPSLTKPSRIISPSVHHPLRDTCEVST